MEKGEPRRPPAKPQFAAGVPASPQWKHDFTLTGEKVADRYAAVGYLEISVVRGGRMLDPSSTRSAVTAFKMDLQIAITAVKSRQRAGRLSTRRPKDARFCEALDSALTVQSYDSL